MKNLLINYTRYNTWANTQVASFLKLAGPAALDTEMKSSFPTLRKTIYHIWDAETIWLNRLRGTSMSSWPSRDFPGSFEEGCERTLENSKELSELVAGFSEEFLTTYITYNSMDKKEYSSKVSDVVMHCMNHSTFHRGQIITMLRNTGFTQFSATDYIAFCRL